MPSSGSSRPVTTLPTPQSRSGSMAVPEVTPYSGFSKASLAFSRASCWKANRDYSPELGPCNVTQNLTTMLNPHAWNEVSNMLFLSQPVGVGFSYSQEEPGSINDFTGVFQNASVGGVDGRKLRPPLSDPVSSRSENQYRWVCPANTPAAGYAVINATAIDTTDLAAISAWHILQGFFSGLPQLDSTVKSKTFNLWTESYGGHYGPSVSGPIFHCLRA